MDCLIQGVVQKDLTLLIGMVLDTIIRVKYLPHSHQTLLVKSVSFQTNHNSYSNQRSLLTLIDMLH